MSPATASVQKSQDDPQGDVQGLTGTVDIPNIDIKKITYAQSDDGSVTITVQVYGNIDQNSIYMVTINTTVNGEENIYNAYYTKNAELAKEFYGSENATALESIEVISSDSSKNGEIEGTFDVIQSNTLRIQYHLLDPDEYPVTVVAVTMFMDTSSEIPTLGLDNATLKFSVPDHSHDNQQNNQNNQNNQDNGEKKHGIPGFETVALIAAVSMATILRKKKL